MADNPLCIRPLTEDDLEAVCSIEGLSFPTPWPVQSFISDLRRPALATYLVAEQDKKVIGYTGFWLIVDEAHITTLAVHPDYRRRHVAEHLLLQLIDAAQKRGAVWMTLEVRVSNDAAHSLYEKFGFQDIAMRKGYYSDNGEDAIVMWTGPIHEAVFKKGLERLKAGFRK
ncbi:MAG: ribosomal protein S18-alanine N-acetyltransferase [bacterium]|jgi:ribosomal-protein-alanine N-acetyltransferase|nr:ribosomal protein S18-alanine N-acetyltransferase [bacterium]